MFASHLTEDSGPKRRTQAIQVPARERGCPRYCRPTTSWGGVAGTSTASRGAAWPAVLFLAEGIADLGEASPWADVRHSDVRGLANGHGCAERRVSTQAVRWTGWPFPAWSVASPMQVDCSVVVPTPPLRQASSSPWRHTSRRTPLPIACRHLLPCTSAFVGPPISS
ncbi:uncharacterized protein LOC142818089 [Rhipicephalus microplus]|uniref:uncharacterized protein LOC142818089 n=1 Tax=Rhipicephalus microplus TaxID=6941 RepID=UPI003F6D72FC